MFFDPCLQSVTWRNSLHSSRAISILFISFKLSSSLHQWVKLYLSISRYMCMDHIWKVLKLYSRKPWRIFWGAQKITSWVLHFTKWIIMWTRYKPLGITHPWKPGNKIRCPRAYIHVFKAISNRYRIVIYHHALQPTCTVVHFIKIDLMVALSPFVASLTYQYSILKYYTNLYLYRLCLLPYSVWWMILIPNDINI